jgi:DNA-binding response OmpR family regulator
MEEADNMNVLLVDDEADIRLLLASVLRRNGIGSISASSLAEAHNALSQGTYDAVFLDIHLPDGMGYELIPAIRQKNPASKVIAISAVDGERATALSAGVDMFLPKPFSRDLVLEKLNALLPGA